MKIVRACIYPKDIQFTTGKTERYGRKLLNEIKVHFGKQPYQFITSEEFAEYRVINMVIANEYLGKVFK